MERNRRIKKKIWILIPILLILGGCIYYVSGLRLTQINVIGNRVYSDQEMQDLVFDRDWKKNTLFLFLNEKLGTQKQIPFVDHYEVSILNPSGCEIMVYEKGIIGCFRYMGSYMYFDRDGIVVENSFNYLSGTPIVEGLDFKQVVLYEPLPVDSSVFQNILSLSNLLKKYSINADKMLYESDLDVVLYLGNVRVRLGNASNLEEKINCLSGMQSGLQGLSGVLYLDSYDPDGSNTTFVFKKD